MNYRLLKLAAKKREHENQPQPDLARAIRKDSELVLELGIFSLIATFTRSEKNKDSVKHYVMKNNQNLGLALIASQVLNYATNSCKEESNFFGFKKFFPSQNDLVLIHNWIEAANSDYPRYRSTAITEIIAVLKSCERQ